MNDVNTVVVADAMTIYQAAEHKKLLLDALAAGQVLRVDLAGVDEIDSAGVQLLLLVQREAEREGKRAELSVSSVAVQEVLGCFGLTDILPGAVHA